MSAPPTVTTTAVPPATESPSTTGVSVPALGRRLPGGRGLYARIVVLGVLGLLVLASPHLVGATSVNIVAKAAVFGIIALSMNVLMGYVGQVSLGHQAFVGVGAFAAGFAITELGLPWSFGIVVAVLVGVVSSLLLGAIALRIRGFYFAIVTIAYGLFAQEVIFNIRAITRGGAGMPAARPGWASGDITYVYVTFAALALVWLFDWRLTASKAGRAIQALRDDERVAASWGINVKAYTLLAFAISGGMAGLAGGLFASIEQLVSPITFSFSLALTFVLMTVVGGLRSRPGVVIGGIVFATLPTLLERAHQHWSWWPFTSLWEPLIGAVLLLATLIKFSGGIAEQLAGPLRWLSFKPFHEDGEVTVGGGAGGGSMGARP